MNTKVRAIQEGLVGRGKSLACAESCTGGRIASALTAISGCSQYFKGSLVAYQNEIKTSLLDVKDKDIEQYDVVSEIVVRQMVVGATKLFGADYAIATTGYADNTNEPTIWIGCGNKDKMITRCLKPKLDRVGNVALATNEALTMCLQFLQQTSDER